MNEQIVSFQSIIDSTTGGYLYEKWIKKLFQITIFFKELTDPGSKIRAHVIQNESS